MINIRSRKLEDRAQEPEAREALDLFDFKSAREIAALATRLGGLDDIVFAAAIGEHQPTIPSAVCGRLALLGVVVEPAANAANDIWTGAATSRVAVLFIPADEEQIIADEVFAVLSNLRLDTYGGPVDVRPIVPIQVIASSNSLI